MIRTYVQSSSRGQVEISEEEYLGLKNNRLPSKMAIAKNAAIASKRAVMSGFKKVSDEEQLRRHSICKANCEFHRKEDDRCSKCGCFTAFKSKLEAWHCPIGKW